MNKTYEIIITKENDTCFSSELIEHNEGTGAFSLIPISTSKSFSFFIRTVLVDILNAKYDNLNFHRKYKNNKLILYAKKKCEMAFGEPIEIDESTNYLGAIINLEKIINDANSLDDFESIKKRKETRKLLLTKLENEKSISYKILLKKPNDNENFNTVLGLKKKHMDEFRYETVKFGAFDNVLKIFENIKDETYRFVYNCITMEEVIFAIFHYLILHDYLFKKCKYCEKWFSTKVANKAYCDRKSSYKGCEYKCKDAAREIQKAIRKKANQIRQNLSKNNYIRLNEFDFKAEPYYIDAKKNPTVKKFDKYMNFLDEAIKKYYKTGRHKS